MTEKGKLFINLPQDVLVLDPSVDPLNMKQPSNVQSVKTKNRNGHGQHYIPKVKEALTNSAKWVKLTSKDHYEYPGLAESATYVSVLSYVEKYQDLRFAPKSRPHFMWCDNQLSKRNTQTNKHEIQVEGVKTKLHIRHGPCEGVKKCSAPVCT